MKRIKKYIVTVLCITLIIMNVDQYMSMDRSKKIILISGFIDNLSVVERIDKCGNKADKTACLKDLINNLNDELIDRKRYVNALYGGIPWNL